MTANNEGKNRVLAYCGGFGIRGFKITLELNHREYQGKPEHSFDRFLKRWHLLTTTFDRSEIRLSYLVSTVSSCIKYNV
jgi:hypothetical protein